MPRLHQTEIAQGNETSIEVSRQLHITSKQDWILFWREHKANAAIIPALPSIDFDRQVVIGVFTDSHYHFCNAVKIHAVRVIGTQLKVEFVEDWNECHAKKLRPISFHIIAVEAASDLTVLFEDRTRISSLW